MQGNHSRSITLGDAVSEANNNFILASLITLKKLRYILSFTLAGNFANGMLGKLLPVCEHQLIKIIKP
jgi:hypothetical protein